MGRGKPTKAAGDVSNKHLYSRMSYLYQAASYLSTQHAQQISPEVHPNVSLTKEDCPRPIAEVASANQGKAVTNIHLSTTSQESKHNEPVCSPTLNLPLSRHLLSNLRTISHKGQIRLSPSIKRSICKKCESLLIPGSSSTHRVDNQSRGGKKPWADVLVVRCNACGTEKRFPVGAKKNPKGRLRERGEGLAGIAEDKEEGEEYVLWSERPDVVMNPKIENAANGTMNRGVTS
jgi:ribonuclease P protein subunit RPR2